MRFTADGTPQFSGRKLQLSAILSPCGTFRYRLDREVQAEGLVFAWFGVNPSTADATLDDQTVRKWRGFTLRNGGRRFIVGNVFSYRATDVGMLAGVTEDCGPEHWDHLRAIIAEADVLIPCWGRRSKLPANKRHRPLELLEVLHASGKPVMNLGLTKDGDPIHPLTLGYDTPLLLW